MFEVVWTDPDRQLVGEHRAKKGKKREQKDKQKTLESRSSLSTRSSRSSVESPFSLFKTRSKNSNATKGDERLKSSGSSRLSQSIASSRSPLSIDSDRSSYCHSVAILDNSDLYSELTRTKDPRPYGCRGDSEEQADATIKTHDSSKSAEPGCAAPSDTKDAIAVVQNSKSKPTEHGKSTRIVQTLGPSSYITKRTEVTWLPRNPDDHTNLISEVLISSDSNGRHPLTPPISPGNLSLSSLTISPREQDSPVNLFPAIKQSPQPKSPLWSTDFGPNNPDAWRPPDEWDCTPSEPRTVPKHVTAEGLPDGLRTTLSEDCSDLSILQKEVKRMATADAEVILSRLKEVWTPTDPSMRQDLEMEKKRWMLSTLHHLDPVPERSNCQPSRTPSAKEPRRILALYESKATASYLAALHYSHQVYHMSATPLSHALFPNISPVFVPSVSASVFPVAPQLFETVYSLSLPALCSSSDIPGVLKNIYQCLRPGGSLQLTLIDPLPCAGTLGHRMRTWLEENLLLNLEKKFRCMNPSRVFPHWLGDASLRGPGSTLTTAKFYAMPACARSHETDPDPFIEQVRTEKEGKAELRSLVGRMLWMEVWGAYVTGGSWWWEDEGCVEECLEMGTFWEYNVIEGIKDGGKAE